MRAGHACDQARCDNVTDHVVTYVWYVRTRVSKDKLKMDSLGSCVRRACMQLIKLAHVNFNRRLRLGGIDRCVILQSHTLYILGDLLVSTSCRDKNQMIFFWRKQHHTKDLTFWSDCTDIMIKCKAK